MRDEKYFVWVAGAHGKPEAQIWFGKQTDGNRKAKPTLFLHEMTKEEGSLGINTLSRLYPYEAKK